MSDEMVNGEETCEQEIKQEKRKLPEAAEPYKWKPGQSGNPNGRPKRKWLTEIYEELLEEVAEDPEQRKALKQSLLAKLHSKGVVSSMILQQVQERTEGKISQPVDLNGQIDIVQIIEEGRKRLG